MIKVQVDQYNMLLAVETHFDINAPIWTSNIPVSDAKTALSATIDQITAAATVQRRNSAGATLDKTALRTALEEKGFFVSSALGAYGSVNQGQDQVFKGLVITKNDFNRFRGGDLLLFIDDLKAAATSVVENLEPYGVTPATLTALMAARVAFHDILKLPGEVTLNRKNATDVIPVLLHEAISMLDNTMDKLMDMLRTAQPEFVNVYFLGRKIHSIGVHTMSLEILTLNANNNTPLVDAHLEVVGKGIKRKSSKSGQNRIQNLLEGNYTLSVSRLNFVSQMIPFTILSGETTQLVIELEEVLNEQRIKIAEELSE